MNDLSAACCDLGTAIEPASQTDPAADARLAALCKALAHPHRVAIVRFLLAQRRCFAGAIADALPIAPSTVSQHLRHLKEAGVVVGEVEGVRCGYCVDPSVLDELHTLLAPLVSAPSAPLECP